MNPNTGQIHQVADEREARRRGLVPIRRELTQDELRAGFIADHAPCACGSGREYVRCCKVHKGMPRRAGSKLARKALRGKL